MNAKKVYILEAKSRKADEKNQELRNAGWIPVVLYGKDFESVQLKVVSNDFMKLFAEAGESSLIDLKADGVKDTKVIVKEVHTLTFEVDTEDKDTACSIVNDMLEDGSNIDTLEYSHTLDHDQWDFIT